MAVKFTGFPGPELVHSCLASKKQPSGVQQVGATGELQLGVSGVGLQRELGSWCRQPGALSVCKASHNQWLGAWLCRGGQWKQATGRAVSGRASWHAEGVGPGVGRRPEMPCLSREPVWASLGGCCMAGQSTARCPHTLAAGWLPCWKQQEKPLPRAVFLQRPLLRRLNIRLTVKEKLLKEYCLLSQNTYGRVNLELCVSELITGMLGLFGYLSSHQISSKDFSNKRSKEMYMGLKNSNNAKVYSLQIVSLPIPLPHSPPSPKVTTVSPCWLSVEAYESSSMYLHTYMWLYVNMLIKICAQSFIV